MAPEDPGAKYELRQQIGRGSFGSAFLVTNKQDNAEFVLKRVRLAKQTKWQRNSTLQERQLATSLRHPFIVPCVESWVVQNHTVNMIYAFCQNGDLSGYLTKIRKQEGQVEESVMQKWLCQLLLALDYLQTQRVLHRDIKTSNLMLTCDNDVQLGDFGLATLMEDHGDEARPQDTNLVGTPHYMSPELLSCKSYGFKTDVWSLGCVFYELTAQRPTFNAFDIHGLVSKIKKNKLAPLPPSYSTEWRDVVSLMLCKNPDRRPSVQQLMALPALRPAMLEARARARELMPGVPLPPLLNPTPLTPQPLPGHCGLAGDQDVADGSEGSAGSASDQHGCDCSAGGGSETDSNRGSCRGDRRVAAGLAAAHAMDASELTELWKANFQQAQDEQLDTDTPKQPDGAQLAAPPQQQQEQECLDQQSGMSGSVQGRGAAPADAAGSSAGGMQDADSLAGCSPSSSSRSAVQGAVDSKGLPAGYSPRNAVGVIDGYKRIVTPKPAHVNQSGIKRTPSERVAAAIAAAGWGPSQPAAAAKATGRVTPDMCARLAPASALSKAPRSSNSSSRQVTPGTNTPGTVTPGTVTPPQGAGSEAGSQSQLSPASVTPRLPSSTTKQPPAAAAAAAAGPTPRQDSGHRQHAQQDGPRAHPGSAGGAASTHAPGSGQAGTPGSSTAAAAAKASPAARPLSAPRSSSVRRMSSGREGEGSGGGARPQRPAWGAGGMGVGRSCLTPGRQRPDQSPLLKAAKAQNAAAAAVAPASAEAAGPAADEAKAAAAAAAALTTRRRSHGQLSPMPNARHSAHGSGSPATEGESVARTGAPNTRQQQQQLELLQRLEEHKRRKQQKERRSSSKAPDAAAAGSVQVRDAVTPGQPAHGLPRSARHTTPGKLPQQQQLGAVPSAPCSSKPQHRHSDPAGKQLPPLALHKLHQADSSNTDRSTTSPQLSPIPLASPVYGQDRQEPFERSSSWTQDTAGRQSRHSAPGTCSTTLTAATAAAAAGGSAATCTSLAETPKAARRSSASSSSGAAEQQPQSRKLAPRQASRTPREQADAALAAAKASSTSSRRVSLGSTGRRSSSSTQVTSVCDSHLDRRSTSQEMQDAADAPAPAAPPSGMSSRQHSGLSTPQRDYQQQQREQQQQSMPQQVPQSAQEMVQHMELLESAMMVISGLVERRRWTELSAVMASSQGLLTSSMYPNLQYDPDARQQQQQCNPSKFKLGDIVALGAHKSIGTIRYIGPVAWDTSGEDWAGMELDTPCGVDGTQRGLTYVQCQPNCASFHKMSFLTSLGV